MTEQPAVESTRPRGGRLVVLLLVIACLGAGALLGWAMEERRWRRQMGEQTRDLRIAASLASARVQELADLLTDEATVLVRMRAVGGGKGEQAAIVWNAARANGMLLVDSLPPAAAGRRYRLRADGADGGPVAPAAGVTLHRFHARRPPRDLRLVEENLDGTGATVLWEAEP